MISAVQSIAELPQRRPHRTPKPCELHFKHRKVKPPSKPVMSSEVTACTASYAAQLELNSKAELTANPSCLPTCACNGRSAPPKCHSSSRQPVSLSWRRCPMAHSALWR